MVRQWHSWSPFLWLSFATFGGLWSSLSSQWRVLVLRMLTWVLSCPVLHCYDSAACISTYPFIIPPTQPSDKTQTCGSNIKFGLPIQKYTSSQRKCESQLNFFRVQSFLFWHWIDMEKENLSELVQGKLWFELCLLFSLFIFSRR